MKRCKHRRVRFYKHDDIADTWEVSMYGTGLPLRDGEVARYFSSYDKVVCDECAHTFSLGPSNDYHSHVQTEIQAARLVLSGTDDGVKSGFWMLDEQHGWRDYADEDGGGDCPCSVNLGHSDRTWHTGYLARAIVEHGDE